MLRISLLSLSCHSHNLQLVNMRQLTLHSSSHSLSTPQSAVKGTSCRSRRALAVSNTLVGPDPRLASSVSAGTTLLDLSRPSKGLKGKEVEEAAMWRCIKLQQAHPGGLDLQLGPSWGNGLLEQAYDRCAEVTSEYAKTFYLGTQLMTPEQARAIWAIYVWCRRTDELVDGPNASRITPKVRHPNWQTLEHGRRSPNPAVQLPCRVVCSSTPAIRVAIVCVRTHHPSQ